MVGNNGSANAIDYTRKRAAALRRYLEDGRDPIDNNAIENAIRPIALRRKNWLFTDGEVACQSAAAIMGLQAAAEATATARMHG